MKSLLFRFPAHMAVAAMLVAIFALRFARAEDAAAPATPAAPATATALPAITLRIESTAPGAPKTPIDVRGSRLVALFVPKGAAPSVISPAGPFRATFEGDLNLRLRDLLSFTAQGRGKLTLTLNGKRVLEAIGDDLSQTTSQPVRLNKGKNHLIAVYESPADGDAALRLLWSSKSFRPEPVPPASLTHAGDLPGLQQSEQLRAGRFLVAQLRCTKCHVSSAASSDLAMPELKQDAPSLAEIGGRLQQAWMAAWIDNPHALRPSAHMPCLFLSWTAAAPDARAADVAAYLASLQPASPSPTPAAGQADSGGKLFARLNCVACHTLPGGADDAARISLQWIKRKFQPAALVGYLQKPDGHYAWNPMPNFHLSAAEASDVAAFLMSFDAPELKTPAGDAKRGQAILNTAGCANCHETPEKSALKAVAFSDLQVNPTAKGCLAQAPAGRGTAPDFAISSEDRVALLAFMAGDRGSLSHDEPSEFATRQMRAMRCTNCHPRDGEEALVYTRLDAEVQALAAKYPPVDLPNEPLAADQHAPVLTWTGEKLRPEWMKSFIAGEVAYKPRPFIRARMPAFTARAQLLTAGLTAEHGYAPSSPEPGKSDPTQAAIGQKLCGATPNESFSCVQCHSVASQPPRAPFEAPSFNFAIVRDRLRKEYYDRWLHDPQRIDPNTKMPRFDDADGKTGVLDVFDGESRKQYDAIWEYLLEGKDIVAPAQ